VANALHIVVDVGYEVLVHCFTYLNENRLHNY
jgi:hypothetical protein